MKKNILFVIESLTLGGAEKSLTTLLNLIDYSKYNVDLQLFSYGGEFQKLVPKEVNILPMLPYFSFCKNSIWGGIKNKNFSLPSRVKMTKDRIKYSFKIRSGSYTHPEKAVILWESSRENFPSNRKKYDTAIAYAQGVPTFYVADCINATKKLAWINSDYKPSGSYKNFVETYYDKFDNVIGVSDVSTAELKEYFPSIKDKLTTIYDINDVNFIKEMAKFNDVAYNEMKFDGIKLLTVGRMCMNKGYDLALDACSVLKRKGINFRWYVVGDGQLRGEIENKIKQNGLENDFILLGSKSNPYPYMQACDIYVQTSRFEGYCLTLTEARILNKLCVTTEFECVYNQMVQEKNGLVVDMNAKAIADGIERMLNDNELRNHISAYLKTEKKGNTEEIEKIYNLIG